MPTLHPQIVQALEAMAKAQLRPIEAMTPTEARAQMEMTARARKAEPMPVARVEERLIPGPAGDMRVRLYWPDAAAPAPAIAYYHGGGHVIGSLDTHDLIARNLCSGVGALVASVDYRMGPEHKFPAAVDDLFAALEWLHANADEPRRRPRPAGCSWRQRRRQPRRSRGIDGTRRAAARNCDCNRWSTPWATTPYRAPAMGNIRRATVC